MTDDITTLQVLDAGVLIALALGESSSKVLAERMGRGDGIFACTEIALCELLYILCRRIGLKKAQEKVDLLIKSSIVRVIPSNILWIESARIKCKVPIALPDCFTIAAIRITQGTGLFARREKEIGSAIRKGLIKESLEFL